MRGSTIVQRLLFTCSLSALASCIVDTGSGDSPTGQELVCTESTIDIGCRCSIAPAINVEVIDECSPSSTDARRGTSVHCCEDRLVVNGKDQGVYLCACRAIRCVATEDRCSCQRDSASPLAANEVLVPDCSGFVSGHSGVTCCANGDLCSCGQGSTCTSKTKVPFCGGESLCVGDIGRRTVDSCR